MKIELKMRGLGRVASLRGFVEQELKNLQQDVSLECARVVLEQESETTTACRASVRLMVPGPDLRATASDYTVLAAWKKTMDELKRQIRERKAQRITRLKSNLQPRSCPSRRA